MMTEVKNKFLTTQNKEKWLLWTGPEFGALEENPFIVRPALYGLKSASSLFRTHMAAKLDKMNFTSCNADPDVWRRPAVKENWGKYYEYLLTYVDYLLTFSEDATRILKELENTFKLKNDKIAPPKRYLGARLDFRNTNRDSCWTVLSADYIKAQ